MLALQLLGPDGEQALEEVRGLLQDSEPKIRALAAGALAELGPKARPAVPSLAKCLIDSDATVRLQSAQALHEVGPDTVSFLSAALKHDNAAVRRTAVQALAIFTDTSQGMNWLSQALSDPEPRVRNVAGTILARLGPKARLALPALVRRLQQDNSEQKLATLAKVLAIGSLDDRWMLKEFRAVNEKSPDVHETTSSQVRPTARDRLTGIHANLAASQSIRRVAALLGAAQLGSYAKEVAPRLQKLLADKNRCVQAAAILAQCAIKSPRKDDLEKVERLLSEFSDELKSAGELDAEGVVQLFVIISTMPHLSFPAEQFQGKLSKSHEWVRQALTDLPSDSRSVAALVEAVNAVGRCRTGVVEPIGTLCLKLKDCVQRCDNVRALARAFNGLGTGIPGKSPLLEAVQVIHFAILKNPSFTEGMIRNKQERMQRIMVGNLQRDQTSIGLAEAKLLAILGNDSYYWVPVPEG